MPKPRVNLTRFHGVFAPNSKHHALVTPAKRGRGNKPKATEESQEQTPAERRASMSWAQGVYSSYTPQDIRQETVELLQALKAYGVEQKDNALENPDNRIDTLESSMLEHWDEMDQAARDKSQSSLQALRQQRTRVAEWYGGMKSSSASAWGHVKEGFSSAYRALQGAWEKSESEFSSDDKK